MSAVEKSRDLTWRGWVPVSFMHGSELNPNKMSDREFDLLVDNMQKTGWTDPILLKPDDTATASKYLIPGEGVDWSDLPDSLTFRIIGGHHRLEAGKYLGFEEAPATVILDPEFDDQAADFQVVRHNVIKGQIDPNTFVDLYSRYASQYGDDVLQEMFGFADEKEFKKLIKQTEKQLPDHMKEKFREATKDVKTVDGLAKVLNRLFSIYGDTLPYSFMVFDYGGQKSYWLQVSNKTIKALDQIGDLCIDKQRTIDDLVGHVLQLIAKGELAGIVEQAVDKSSPVEIPDNLQLQPTQENIEQHLNNE